jgi:hypothetical protein
VNKHNDIKQRLLARRQEADTWIAQQRYYRLSPAAKREQHELARSPTGTGPTMFAGIDLYHPDGWLMSERGNRYGNWTILVDLNNGRYTVTEHGSRSIPTHTTGTPTSPSKHGHHHKPGPINTAATQ